MITEADGVGDKLMENIVTLKCFHCGKTKKVVIDGEIHFSYELYDIANKAGMLGCIDWARKRALVFCDEKCKNAHLTKSGTIKIRPGFC